MRTSTCLGLFTVLLFLPLKSHAQVARAGVGAYGRQVMNASGPYFHLSQTRKPHFRPQFSPRVSQERAPFPPSSGVYIKRTNKNVSRSINLFSGRYWPNVQGDTEMGTNSKQYASAYYRSQLKVVRNCVYLVLTFEAAEHGGDYTKFAGTREISMYYAPIGRRSVDVRAVGGPVATDYRKVRGAHRGKKRFDIARTHWTDLIYTIDNRGKDWDDIGLKGTINFTVVTE